MAVSFFQTVQSFAQFLLNWKLKGGKLVDQNTANIRASVCASCHNNLKSNEVTGKVCCGGNRIVSAAVKAARSQIVKDQKTTSDARLLTCGLCGCDLKIKVWIPNEVLVKSDDANAYPTFCWVKKILDGTDI